MVFFCQRNCYKREFITNVVSCIPVQIQDCKEGIKKACYEAIFKDTVFFPEGGGQPYDTGFINDSPVFKVIRRGGEAVHYIDKPLETDAEVIQVINWTRRHDHMQQHSAQHLITALADQQYNFPTSSWNLGEKISYIELDTPNITNEQVKSLEDIVNSEIRKSVPVITKEYETNDAQLKLVRTRGLPPDAVGPVRVVTIEGIDSNMCCGTHVHNLADLQVIKLLNTEKGKGNKTLLHFVAGKRILSYLDECVTRERTMTTILHSNADDHVRLVEKLKKDFKQSSKSLKDALLDLSVTAVTEFQRDPTETKVFFHHRRDGTSEYLGAIIKAFKDDKILKIVTAGEDSGPGVLIIHGPEDIVKSISPRICEILDGKGGGKTRFTAKVTKLGRKEEMKKYVLDFLASRESKGNAE